MPIACVAFSMPPPQNARTAQPFRPVQGYPILILDTSATPHALPQAALEGGLLEIYGARAHNLKNIDLLLPRNQLVVITGLSGSGKSSLAFDTVYAEGQRRYMESFSAYARQFIGGMERPDVDKIEGLSPVISIEQKTVSRNPRSTVGTITEVYDFFSPFVCPRRRCLQLGQWQPHGAHDRRPDSAGHFRALWWQEDQHFGAAHPRTQRALPRAF